VVGKGVIGGALGQQRQVPRRHVDQRVDGRWAAVVEARGAQDVQYCRPQQAVEEVVLRHGWLCKCLVLAILEYMLVVMHIPR